MTHWISELKKNLAGEFEKRPVVATLATIGTASATHRADARSIVIRDLLDDGTIIITSDACSEKNAQLRSNPSATVVLWLPALRWQCIVDAQASILGHESTAGIRLDQWRKLSDSTRAMFAWPAPGEAFDSSAVFAEAIAADANPPESFEVLVLKPIAVETLNVRAHPHRRIIWSRTVDEWTSRVVNP